MLGRISGGPVTTAVPVRPTAIGSDDAGSTPTVTRTRGPTGTPNRTVTVTLDSGEETRREDFLDEPGRFRVVAELEMGEAESTTVELYETADGGVGADAISVETDEEGRLRVGAFHHD